MKVLSVITGLGCGGAETLLLDICTEQKKRGFEQKVIYLTKREFHLPAFESLGIELELIDVYDVGIIKAILKLRKSIKNYCPDVVNSHLVMADSLTRIACFFLKKIKVFSTIHSLDKWKEQKTLSSFMLRLFNRITINCIKNYNLIAVSKSAMNFCIEKEKIRKKNIFLVYNFIPQTGTKNTPPVTRAELGFSDTDFVITNIGRMVEEKSQITLLEATKKLIDDGFTNIRVIILGDGELRCSLEEYATKNKLWPYVKMPGFANNTDSYLSISDVLVTTSIIEGFSLTPVEAFKNKVPVIASDLPTIKEFITDRENGLLFPTANANSLAALVVFVMNKQIDIKTIVENAYKTYTFFNADAFFEKITKLYNNLTP